MVRIWLLSKLFLRPSKGRFPPHWVASVRALPPLLKVDDRPHALLAVGGALTEETLLTAYSQGIYPIYEKPVKWIAHNPGMVLFLEKTRIEKRLRGFIRSGRYRVTFDTAFEKVVQACSDRKWTWLVPERIDIAIALHKRGQAHSVEVWNKDDELVGGIFGVAIGKIFVAESSFHSASNAGKVADAYLCCHLQHWGYELCDGQAHSPHLELLGFEEIPHRDYARLMKQLAGIQFRSGPWVVDDGLDVAGWIPSSPGSQIKKGVGDSQTGV